jgi:hypothetical protein
MIPRYRPYVLPPDRREAATGTPRKRWPRCREISARIPEGAAACPLAWRIRSLIEAASFRPQIRKRLRQVAASQQSRPPGKATTDRPSPHRAQATTRRGTRRKRKSQQGQGKGEKQAAERDNQAQSGQPEAADAKAPTTAAATDRPQSDGKRRRQRKRHSPPPHAHHGPQAAAAQKPHSPASQHNPTKKKKRN